MNFARYWQSIEVEVPDRFGRPARVRVWGGSDVDAAAARGEAAARVGQVLEFFARSGNDYSDGAGFIREEVIDELIDDGGARLAMITRNRYGALVLNTERVLFGDIDLPQESALLRLCNRFGRQARDKHYFIGRIRAFQAAHSDFTFQVYETRAGLRFIVTNREISPDGPEVELLFAALPVDPLYTRLCRAQLCFRARLTAKPWRIGLPQPKVRFPFASDLEQRSFDFWLDQYLAKARNTCAARRVERIGDAPVLPAIQRLLDVHDRYACDDDAVLA